MLAQPRYETIRETAAGECVTLTGHDLTIQQVREQVLGITLPLAKAKFSIAGCAADRLNRTTVLQFETDNLSSNVIANPATRSGRHDGASNVAFIDGHVKRARLGEVLRGNP